MKTKKTTHSFFGIRLRDEATGRLFRFEHDLLTLVIVFAVVAFGVRYYLPRLDAAGLDSVTVSLSNETVNTDARVTVSFEVGNLSNGETIGIYLGEDTTGDEWQLDGITTSHISCSDNGAGETYTATAVNAASASVAMNVAFTATTVGAGATTVTCLIGDGGANNPNNPTVADGYSVAVATTEDAGAGIAYVGNANDVTVSVQLLSNLALTVNNADGTRCTTTAGVTSCNLGTVLTTTVAQGNYDVNVGTNASSGATLQLTSDGQLRNGANTIAAYVEDSGAISAGTEEYGIDLASDVGWTEQGNFTDDATAVPTSPTNVATTAAENDIAGADITVTHKVAIDSTVPAFLYSHIVTWTATGNF
ncbi:MAG: hypothetical protein HZC01_02665 [Candidatus Kerfeldbacteria bacterium]|nr:hypothetical protein [Candidatus Kerfeldbacteria bacterium]